MGFARADLDRGVNVGMDGADSFFREGCQRGGSARRAGPSGCGQREGGRGPRGKSYRMKPIPKSHNLPNSRWLRQDVAPAARGDQWVRTHGDSVQRPGRGGPKHSSPLGRGWSEGLGEGTPSGPASRRHPHPALSLKTPCSKRSPSRPGWENVQFGSYAARASNRRKSGSNTALGYGV